MIVPTYELTALGVYRIVAGLIHTAGVVESEVCAERVVESSHGIHKVDRAVCPIGVGLNV